MIKQEIEYEDFDGVKHVETHYFHLSKKKLMTLTGQGADFQAKLERIGKSANGAEIMQTFTEIVGHAYGERVEDDASAFRQSPEISARFLDSLAFESFLMKLITDVNFAVNFVNGILPKDLLELAAKAENTHNPVVSPHPDGSVSVGDVTMTPEELVRATGLQHPLDINGAPLPWAFREPTHKEFSQMSQPQMAEVYTRKSSGWIPTPAVSNPL